MRHRQRPKNFVPLICAGALACASITAGAEETALGDDWRYSASIYLWGAGIKGETAAGSVVDIGFDTLISNLNMAFMGAFEARRSQ